MSTGRSRIVLGLTVVVLLCAATIAAIVPKVASGSPSGVREIRLVVRDMTYYAEGDAAPNPTLRVGRGEQVRVVLRNEDAGMIHDFAIEAWKARTPGLNAGQEAVVRFRAPTQPGVSSYSCTPHGAMMRGTIRVE